MVRLISQVSDLEPTQEISKFSKKRIKVTMYTIIMNTNMTIMIMNTSMIIMNL